MIRAAATSLARQTIRSSSFRRTPVINAAPQQHLFHSTNKSLDKDDKSGSAAVKKEEEKGWWDPVFLAPIGLFVAAPVIQFKWYIISDETLLLGCFLSFATLVYKNYGGAIYDALMEDGRKTLAYHNQLEDEMINSMKTYLGQIKEQENIVQDAESVYALKAETYEKLNAAGKNKPLYEYKAQVERLLNVIAHEEASMKEKAKHKLMAEATSFVKGKFASDKSLQKNSLDAAIAQLEGKQVKKADPVQATFVEFFQNKVKQAGAISEEQELAQSRAAVIAKMNAVAMNEGFYFKWDEVTGKPKMLK